MENAGPRHRLCLFPPDQKARPRALRLFCFAACFLPGPVFLRRSPKKPAASVYFIKVFHRLGTKQETNCQKTKDNASLGTVVLYYNEGAKENYFVQHALACPQNGRQYPLLYEEEKQ
ncbi:MAG: hypothetical protein SOX72_02020 [Oscillospiraceae bacterium]|nr:hypothetical protein [Oscillospiraceae bacterium]MDY4190978.1 hypothetical protein [Oscillospiraceae bacterium]